MKGIYVNETGGTRYAQEMASGYKTIETRTRDTLKGCAGERVAIIRTRKGQRSMVVGYAYIGRAVRLLAGPIWEKARAYTLIPPGSRYDIGTRPYKYGYPIRDAETCAPYPLPEKRVNHGRAWCEFDMKGDR